MRICTECKILKDKLIDFHKDRTSKRTNMIIYKSKCKQCINSKNLFLRNVMK